MWIFLGILTYILFWLACIVSYTIEYLTTNIQVASFSQVIYTLQNGMTGSESTVMEAIGGFFVSKGWLVALATLIFAGWIWICIRRIQAEKKGEAFSLGRLPQAAMSMNCVCLVSAVACAGALGMNVREGYQVLGVQDYLDSQNKVSELYEEHYADPAETKITFPEQKRNLVYIVCESMERSFTDREHGGGFENDLIPELYQLAKESGTDFSYQTEDLNGALVANNTGWTIAGLVAQSAGIPLNVGNGDFNRNFEGESKFLPFVTTLGDILEDQGYRNAFVCGSDASFAGRRNYYEQHGSYEIYDLLKARSDGTVAPDYHVWWGYEDKVLFDYAKKILGTMENEQPFNLTMLTVDTHFTDGYLCPDCGKEFETQYENVIHCSDHRIVEFVKWLQQQPYYENTTVVITGDHLSMDAMVPAHVEPGYERKAFACVLNGPAYTQTKTRAYTTMDLFPTIVESLGAQIEGHRLGLGTSLYSDEPTLTETLGFDEFNRELAWTSDYYNRVLMSGDQSALPKQEPAGEEQPAVPVEEPAAAITAQEYQENIDNFQDTNFIYIPPAAPDPGYTYPEYSEDYYDPGYYEPSTPVTPAPAPTPSPAPDPTPDPTPTPDPDPVINPDPGKTGSE